MPIFGNLVGRSVHNLAIESIGVYDIETKLFV